MPIVGSNCRGSRVAAAGAFLLCLSALPTVGGTARPDLVVTRPVAPAQNDWDKYCGSLSMNGVAAGERVLTVDSVPTLELLWTRKLGGVIASAPSVARGKVYIGDWSGHEWALDTATGAVIAMADLGRTNVESCSPSSLGITSSASIVGNVLYVAGGDDGFYKLDADTLRPIWRRSLGDNTPSGGYYGWCSPAVAGGKVLQGIASNCDDPFPRGALVAIDTATGEISETSYFVPENQVGGGVWTSPAVDVDRRKIFVTTGSSNSIADQGDAFSMVRLDLDTLLIEDRWKLPDPGPDEQWDADWGSSPTLFTGPDGRQFVGAGHKDGGYYAFDRNDLAAGPVWLTSVAIMGATPQAGEGTISTAAFDGKTLYVGGGIPMGNEDPAVLGAVTALSPGDGKVLWQHTFAGPVIAPVSFANGVVIAVGGRSVVALDADTGSLIWSYQMKAAGFGGVAIARGRLYVGDLFGTIYAFGILPNN